MNMPPQQGMGMQMQNQQSLSPLDQYLLQRKLAQAAAMGPAGAGGQPAAPIGPGIADPFAGGESGTPLVNPLDGQNEFNPQKRMQRPYLGG